MAPTHSPLLRIGAVSQSTGIPVSTIRIWETRYGAFSPVKTAGKQRLFGPDDVSKALLLRQLVQEGHAIGTIAALDLAQLHQLRQLPSKARHQRQRGEAQLSLAVVGLSLANRMTSKPFATAVQPLSIKVTDVWPDLAAAQLADVSHKPQVLMIKASTLHPEVHLAIRALLQKQACEQTIVLYNYAPEGIVQSMKQSGLIVRREPLSDAELAELLQHNDIHEVPSKQFALTGHAVAQRKYSDETLTRVAGISTQVLCECPRHVAELIAQLASFEEYSQQCLQQHSEDAHLHAYLHAISGSARSMFEDALEKIAHHEGIALTRIAHAST